MPVVLAEPPKPTGASLERQTNLADLRKSAERKAQLAAQMPAVLDASSPPTTSSSSLQAELQQLKMPELRKRAAAAGISKDDIEDARDADEPKQAMISLMLSANAPTSMQES